MLTPLRLKCPTCGAPRTQRVDLNDPSPVFTCDKCGDTCLGIPRLDVTVGGLILDRSRYELEIEKDYDMAIVLAATALDCELSSLYRKWKGIDALRAGRGFNPEDCENELRGLGNVAEKITKVSGMLCGGGIEKFVAGSVSWKEELKQFPCLHAGSLATDFQKTVFWPRNKVLHQGQATHTQEDARRCYRIADLGIGILKDMDKARAQLLQSQQSAARRA